MTKSDAVLSLKTKMAAVSGLAAKTIGAVNEVMQRICGSILVLDDDTTILSAIGDTINSNQAWKLDMKYASDLATASSIISTCDIRVALVDFYLVNSDTKNFCLMLKTRRIPTIIMTGLPTDDVLQFCKSENIRLIVKPFRMDELYAELQESLIESALNRKTEAA